MWLGSGCSRLWLVYWYWFSGVVGEVVLLWYGIVVCCVGYGICVGSVLLCVCHGACMRVKEEEVKVNNNNKNLVFLFTSICCPAARVR